MTTLLAQAKQLESALQHALHNASDATLPHYADALLSLQRCLEHLEKLETTTEGVA